MADSGGGGSASSSRDGDDSQDPPQKKARYSWEIQGNTNLKTDKTVSSENSSRSHREAPCTSDHGASHGCLNVGRLVTSSNYPVFKWQTRQIAKAVVDNTINKVIEDMGFVPFAQDFNDMFPMNQQDEHVEDEAVLMAIHRHGLQQKDWMSSSSHTPEKLSTAQDTGLAQLKSWYEFENDENTVAANSWRINELASAQGSSNISIMEPRATQPTLSYPDRPSENQTQSVCDKSVGNASDKNVLEHDFLAQAVAVAIQKKGLSTYLANENR
ncbi:uncharacterized protein [Bemisia tabaci]|uniref:uncharacterized protein n=1 Tax=Bemisia tabaci TaxID=7038 RepID=UPI003B281245